jgi:hypothetical protein
MEISHSPFKGKARDGLDQGESLAGTQGRKLILFKIRDLFPVL